MPEAEAKEEYEQLKDWLGYVEDIFAVFDTKQRNWSSFCLVVSLLFLDLLVIRNPSNNFRI